MAQLNVTITVVQKGKGCKVPKKANPWTAMPQRGDDIVWEVVGDQGSAWVVIGDFKKKGSPAACPMEESYYAIEPGQGSVVGRVKPSATKGVYNYRVRAQVPMKVGVRAAQHLSDTSTITDGGGAVLGAPVIMLSSDADSEMNPEIQIGGTGCAP